ncbi:MAG: hypothetical protein WDW36_009219 [Sanguina aurantia]
MASASDFEHPTVAHLTAKNYEESIYMVKFYAPWCGHCKSLAAGWKQLADDLESTPEIVIAHVDCTVDRDVCSSADVKGYPTLKVFHKGELYKPYQGARQVEAMKAFLMQAKAELLTESR